MVLSKRCLEVWDVCEGRIIMSNLKARACFIVSNVMTCEPWPSRIRRYWLV